MYHLKREWYRFVLPKHFPFTDVLKTISEKQWPNPKLERKLMTCWEKDLLSELLKVIMSLIFVFVNISCQKVKIVSSLGSLGYRISVAVIPHLLVIAPVDSFCLKVQSW